MLSLKVVHVLASHKWTGPAEGVITLCRDLRAAGHRVRIFCTPNPRRLLADQAAQRGIVPEEALRLTGKNLFQTLWDIRRLKGILDEERPDILHLHLSTDHWVGGPAARWAGGGCRVVRTIHHGHTLQPRILRSSLHGSLTDGFITLCRRDRDELKRLYRLGSKPVAVIHGAVDIHRFHPEQEVRLGRSEFGLGNSTPVVGMVARFQPHRRHSLMLETMARLQKDLPTVRLLLVGRGEHQPVIEEMARNLGLGQRVIFAGYRDRDLPQIYAAMDVCVLLASGSDGSCRAALEAMAVGRPMVGFPVGALPETIVDGVTGHIVKEGNAEVLATCLGTLLSDRHRLQAMGQASRKRIESDFSEAGRLRETEKFYETVLKSGHS